MDNAEQMIRNVEEALLGNSRLTADLEDDAADVLLNWAIACARTVIRETVDEYPADLEGAVDGRVTAIRKMARAINTWTASRGEKDAEEQAAAFENLWAYAAVVYGNKKSSPDTATVSTFIETAVPLPADQFIHALRILIEG